MLFKITLPLLSLLSFSAQPAANVTLTVQVPNVQAAQGAVQMALYNDPAKFPSVSGPLQVLRVPATGSAVTGTFSNLPPGAYALAIFHDKNNDGVCNLNLLGIPTEPYGFSNNPRPWLRAPTFKEAQVDLQQTRTIQITLVH